MIDELTAIGGGKTLLHFAEEPFVVAEHAFHGFDDKRFAIATLLGGNTGELFLEAGIEANFHEARLGIGEGGVNSTRKQAKGAAIPH